MKKNNEKLKKKLEENKNSLRKSLQRFAKEDKLPEGDWDTIFPDLRTGNVEDMSDEVEEYTSLLSIEHALETKLKNVEDALKKIEKGTYGKCEKCGKEIPYKKLEITPESKTCMKCG